MYDILNKIDNTKDLKKLNKRDQEIYSSMSDSEKKQFENLWETM